MKNWVVWGSPGILHYVSNTQLHTNYTQMNRHVNAEVFRPDSEINCWLWSNVNMVQSIYPRVAGWRKPTFFFCGKAAVWHQLMKPAASLCPCNSFPFLFFCGGGAGVVTRAACDAVRAPHLTELSHQGPFIRNSAGLLFLLLTACVFILRMRGFSAHSCFSSTPMFF